MTDQDTTEGAGSEPIAGTNLTTITEYSETALALSELRGRFLNLVPDLSTPKGLKAAKADVAELRTLRTSLDKKREELVKPALERQREVNAEAKRLTAEIVALEEPLKLQVDAKEAEIENARLQKLEDERLRVEAILNQIQAIRDIPLSLVGKPAVIIQGQLAKLQQLELTEEGMAEHYQTALDAKDAVIGRVTTMLHEQKETDAEKARHIAREAEMAEMQRKLDAQQKLIDDAEADRVERARLKAVEEAAAEQAKQEAAAAAQRKIDEDEQRRVQAIRDRISSIAEYGVAITGRPSQWLLDTLVEVDGMRPSDSVDFYAEFLDEANAARNATIEKVQAELEVATAREKAEVEAKVAREAEEARQQVERDRQAAEQKKLDAQAEQLRKDKAAATKKAEGLRLASLGLREAAQAVVDANNAPLGCDGDTLDKLIDDLAVALTNDAAPAKTARSKRTAQA